MANDKKTAASHVCSCGTSVVCMAQMGATGAAAGTMGAMGAVGTATAVSTPFITLTFQAIGLGFLLALPALFYQALLVAILAFTAFSSYLSRRRHKRQGPFVLTLISSLLVYGSIYLLASEVLYWASFVLMFISGTWNYVATRQRTSRLQKESRSSTQQIFPKL